MHLLKDGHVMMDPSISNRKIRMFPKIVGFPPKSSILIGFSIINHPFWGIPIFGNTHTGAQLARNSGNVQVYKCQSEKSIGFG